MRALRRCVNANTTAPSVTAPITTIVTTRTRFLPRAERSPSRVLSNHEKLSAKETLQFPRLAPFAFFCVCLPACLLTPVSRPPAPCPLFLSVFVVFPFRVFRVFRGSHPSVLVLAIADWRIRICFGFRVSCFGFPPEKTEGGTGSPSSSLVSQHSLNHPGLRGEESQRVTTRACVPTGRLPRPAAPSLPDSSAPA